MVSELAPHDSSGRFVRDYSAASFIAPPSPTLDPAHSYHLYLGNPCPWCHRISLALPFLSLPASVTVTMLGDDAAKATKGGWVVPGEEPLCGARDL
jgi:putative glutathione S-transferase